MVFITNGKYKFEYKHVKKKFLKNLLKIILVGEVTINPAFP